MDELSGFFAMGGYAGYVWPAYGLAVTVLVALAVTSLRALRAREAEVAALEATRERRRPAGDSR
jgi:heme exporter protein D